MDDNSAQVIQVTHPGDLALLAAHTLGFWPSESITLISLRGPRRRSGLIARLDLDDATTHPEATFREAELGDLVKDLARLGPAPNRSREAFVAVTSVLLLGVIVAVLRPDPVVSTVISVALVAYLAVRWAIGTRTWGQR